MPNINPETLEGTPHETLQRYIDQMDDYQARLVLGFIKRLFNLSD